MIHARNDYQRIQDPTNKIPNDEPVFLLRAQDKTAAEVVRYWVRLNRRALTEDKKKGGDLNIEGRRKAIVLAEAHAFRMDDWEKKKAADV